MSTIDRLPPVPPAGPSGFEGAPESFPPDVVRRYTEALVASLRAARAPGATPDQAAAAERLGGAGYRDLRVSLERLAAELARTFAPLLDALARDHGRGLSDDDRADLRGHLVATLATRLVSYDGERPLRPYLSTWLREEAKQEQARLLGLSDKERKAYARTRRATQRLEQAVAGPVPDGRVSEAVRGVTPASVGRIRRPLAPGRPLSGAVTREVDGDLVVVARPEAEVEEVPSGVWRRAGIGPDGVFLILAKTLGGLEDRELAEWLGGDDGVVLPVIEALSVEAGGTWAAVLRRWNVPRGLWMDPEAVRAGWNRSVTATAVERWRRRQVALLARAGEREASCPVVGGSPHGGSEPPAPR